MIADVATQRSYNDGLDILLDLWLSKYYEIIWWLFCTGMFVCTRHPPAQHGPAGGFWTSENASEEHDFVQKQRPTQAHVT